ncbi:MAG: protein translocase subunit SecF [Lysobacteraceae bacterium]
MEFFNPNSNVDFMRVRKVTVSIAVLLMVASIVAIATKGLNLALDFTGGTLVEVNFDQSIEQPEVVERLEAAGIQGALVQRFDTTNYSVRLAPALSEEVAAGIEVEDETSLDARNAAVGQMVLQALRGDDREVDVLRSEFVGPQVGRELAYDGIVAVCVVLAGIMIYIAFRFEWKFSVATVIGEAHDVLVTLGIFAILGIDFDLAVLAAILAVDGYSVNDKIVVFDRVRELFRSTRNKTPVEVLNRAINTTLSRTIMTSLTTLITVTALYLFGGPTLQGFAFALMIGVVVGTLSTIFYATPLLLTLGVNKQDLMPKERDEEALNARP